MSFNGTTRLYTGWKVVDASATDEYNFTSTVNLSDGSGSGEADGAYYLEDVVLTSGNSTEYDLTSLSRDLFGSTGGVYEFIRISAVQIISSSNSTGNLLIGGAASNTWLGPFGNTSDKLTLYPGSGHLLTGYSLAAWPVTSGSKTLKVEASSGDVTYSIVLLGNLQGNSGS